MTWLLYLRTPDGGIEAKPANGILAPFISPADESRLIWVARLKPIEDVFVRIGRLSSGEVQRLYPPPGARVPVGAVPQLEVA